MARPWPLPLVSAAGALSGAAGGGQAAGVLVAFLVAVHPGARQAAWVHVLRSGRSRTGADCGGADS
jgi:hypothetical protein